jgi:hypothetical protein
MNIPGANLLSFALSVIGSQTVTWHRANGRIENELGQWMTQYAPAVEVAGSWQSVDRTKYTALGLDLAKTYYNFYASVPIEGIQREVSPDLLDFKGRRHEVVNVLDWSAQDGWRGVMVVDVGPVP